MIKNIFNWNLVVIYMILSCSNGSDSSESKKTPAQITLPASTNTISDVYTIQKRVNEIAIDGNLNDWQNISEGRLINTAQQVAIWGGRERSTPPDDYSTADLSAVFWAQWDDQNIYIAIKVTDDNLIVPDHSPSTGNNWWLDDEVEISFDLGNNTNGTAHDNNDAIICFTYNKPNVYGSLDYSTFGELTARFTGKHAHGIIDEHNYVLEVKIPFTLIDENFVAQAGKQIKFDISPEDEDQVMGGRDGQMFWLCEDANAWTDASQWGVLTFSE